MLQLANTMFQLFKGNRSTYGVQRRETDGSIYYFRVTGKEVLPDTYLAHLKGEETIGVYPLLASKKYCYFACIDIDAPDLELARKAMSKLPQPNYLERSRSGNYHIWMFFKQPLEVRDLVRACQPALDFIHSKSEQHCNIYPLCPSRTTDVGLMIALPLQPAHMAKGTTVFLDSDDKVITDHLNFFRAIDYTRLLVNSVRSLNRVDDKELQFIETDEELRGLWLGEGKRNGDKTASGYDFSLCKALFLRDLTRTQVTTLLQNRPGLAKDSKDYIKRTVEAAEKAAEAAKLQEKEEAVQSWEKIAPIDRETYFKTIETEVILEQNQIQHMDMFFACMAANICTQGRPVWMIFIGPPGSGKTLPMMAIQHSPFAYSCSAFRPTALISGWGMRGGEDMSLIPRLDGKVLLIKDMSSLLSQNRDVVAEVMGLLRDAYDGSCCRAYGTGVERAYTARFGFVGAATPDVDMHWSLNVRLGERFLRYRVRSSMAQVYRKIDMTLESFLEEEKSSSVLEDASLAYLKYVLRTTSFPRLANPTRIGRLAQLGAILRTSVARSTHSQQVLVIPEWEEATRYTKQLAKMALALAHIRGKDTETDEEFEDLKTLVRDSIDARIERICALICKEPNSATDKIAAALSLPEWTVRACLNDLEVSRVVTRSREAYSLLWDFVPWIRGQIEEFKLW